MQTLRRCITIASPMTTQKPAGRFDLLISDVDGCLTTEDPLPLDLQRLAQVAQYNRLAFERGDQPPMTVCTGRPQPFAEVICRLIHNISIPCVCENGVWLYHPGENTYHLDPSITLEHRRMIHEVEAWIIQTFGPDGAAIQPGKTAAISITHERREYLRTIVPALETQVAGRAWALRVSMTLNYINLDLAHISKRTGVKRLLETLDLPRDRVAGIGDTVGDLALAEQVGYFACPANAEEVIKDRADYVSPLPEIAGVIDILEHLAAT